MAVLKMKASKSKCSVIQNYLEKDNRAALVSTVNIANEKNWASEMQQVKVLHNQTKGRAYYHIIQSFENEESKENYEEEIIHEAGKALIKELEKQGYQAIVVTHNDTNNLHNHIIINSVNVDTGKKLHLDNEMINKLHKRNDQICEKLGLNTLTQSKKQKDEIDRKAGIMPKSRKTDEIYVEQRKKTDKDIIRDKLNQVFSNQNITTKSKFEKELLNMGLKIARNTEKTGITYEDISTGKRYRAKTLGGYNNEDVSNMMELNLDRSWKKTCEEIERKRQIKEKERLEAEKSIKEQEKQINNTKEQEKEINTKESKIIKRTEKKRGGFSL